MPGTLESPISLAVNSRSAPPSARQEDAGRYVVQCCQDAVGLSDGLVFGKLGQKWQDMVILAMQIFLYQFIITDKHNCNLATIFSLLNIKIDRETVFINVI